MRDELAVETIENSSQIGRNHPMIQQRPMVVYVCLQRSRSPAYIYYPNCMTEKNACNLTSF
ncbi:MAG: hypothetical protein HXY43_10805 [Fischerella sp.]|uniref:hypothetical protein n=1 Tax=Fischerella sp. TaxID=1191 RepID=UPI0017F915E0|nr:hypothetical protein [Fischerella sp.]NWF59759.1 hypothetical protein [Fischerella sp.]